MAVADDGSPITSGTAETPADFDSDGKAGIVSRYLSEIRVYDRGVKAWADSVKKIVDRYRNKWPTPDRVSKRKYSLLWSTIQVQTPALFYHVPTPVVERRWKDDEDFIASTGAEILDRALTYVLDMGDFKPSVDAAVFDYQIAGRGVVWLRKEVDHGEVMDGPTNGADAPDETTEGGQIIKPDDTQVREVLDERICIDPVPWSDFGHTLARNWKEVTIVWRKLFMTRDQLVERFGQDLGNKVELDYEPTDLPDDQSMKLPPHLYKLATVYEIWDRTTLEAIWVAVGYKDGPLDVQKDPLRVTGFFPCPRPIWSSLDTTSLIPLPDYTMWEDQAREVDELTERLHRLIKACKVRGAFDASFSELESLMDESLELDLIPITKWAEFAQKGGLDGAIDFLPLKEIIETVGQLYNAREQAKRDASEISGVGDIIRGQNAGPEQTATQARITGQFGTLRLQDRQREIQRFCRDIIRMMGELIAEGFLPETLEQMTGVVLPTKIEKSAAQGIVDQYQAYQQWQASQSHTTSANGASSSPAPPNSQNASAPTSPTGMQGAGMNSPPTSGMPSNVVPFQPPAPPPPQPVPQDKLFQAGETLKKPTWDDVIARFRDDKLRSFTIDIETDSTIAADEEKQKANVSEFVENVGSFLTQMLPVVQQAPEIAPFAMEMLKYGARRFDAGRQMETVIDEVTDRLLTRLSKPQQASPDPKMVQAQAQAQAAVLKGQAEMQVEAQKAQSDSQLDAQKAQADFALRGAQAQADAQLQQQKAQSHMELQAMREIARPIHPGAGA